MSIGGATSGVSFGDDGEARDFADRVWEVFGGGAGQVDGELRPFGGVEVDGFDVGGLFFYSAYCREEVQTVLTGCGVLQTTKIITRLDGLRLRRR